MLGVKCCTSTILYSHCPVIAGLVFNVTIVIMTGPNKNNQTLIKSVVSIDLFCPFFMPFLYNGAYWNYLVLSIFDVIVSRKTVQWRIKVTFLWVGQQISLALLSSLRSENKFGANTFWVDPFPWTVISKILLNYTKTVSQGIINKKVL